MSNVTMWTNAAERVVGVLALVILLGGSGCKRSTSPSLAYSRGNVEEIRRLMQEGGSGDKEETSVALADPTGWATLRGRFTLNGAPPPRPPLKVDKDLQVCAAPGTPPVLSESVVIGSDNGIKNVLIYLTTAIPLDNPKWLHESYASLRGSELPFDQKNCVFLTHVGSMWVEQRLRVLNSDPVGHNTNLASTRGARAENFLVPAGSSSPYDPGKPSPAPFSVSCSIHPWMNAWMMVCENPYFAVTGGDGSFEIPNLPAGVSLEFRVWQEKATYLQQVTLDGAPATWSRGRYEVTLSADKEINVAVDASVFQ